MRFFHTIGVLLYGSFIFLAQSFNPKAKKWWQGRKNYWKQLPVFQSDNVVWFHCASLGEFDQGIPVMQALKEKSPSTFLIVTFFSPSGMEHYHKRQHSADWVGYLPLPTPKNAQRFIHYFQPKKVFFVKYEFWDNFLVSAKKINAETYCISANFRKKHRFFGAFGFLFRPTLFLFDKIFVQNETSRKLLETIGYKNGILAGDTRIDKVLENKQKIEKDEVVSTFLNGEKAIILGSSWTVDEELWKKYIDQNPQQKFIIAPHDISENHIQAITKLFPSATRYTDTKKIETNILIIDCIGKLSNLYQYALLAYIGGGFTGKLHNILEPAVFQIPIIIGTKHERFPEAQQLINKGVVKTFSNSDELAEIIEKQMLNQEIIAKNAQDYFDENKNVAERIVREVL